ncbi:signal peptidase I [Bacillus carboniphilus]|uniref:Signal peptidase I n=1 Tax=Bacillus carboniphilus TaxID=86663 RepID=A0ABY9JVX8_9BACI|nr:signal peptidase I [Bacillus carboniphilus]WLR43554.1 signal peptidase I [Bacillus carboniphilus]
MTNTQNKVVEKKKKEWFEWVKALGIAVILAVIIRSFLFAPVVVDGESMTPTLLNQDRMIVNKIGYSINGLDRFDIVVFHATEDKDYIKRVIGLPGDEIEYRDDQLYINGEEVDEPFLDEQKEQVFGLLTEDFTLEERTGKLTVPDNEIFVMGDNRRNSQDSRHIGTVPMSEVMGKTEFVFWPVEDFGMVE